MFGSLESVHAPISCSDAGFNTCKAVAGLDLRQILERAQINLGTKLESGSILADFNDPGGDRIQVILE